MLSPVCERCSKEEKGRRLKTFSWLSAFSHQLSALSFVTLEAFKMKETLE
jgi:hypothetical protein